MRPSMARLAPGIAGTSPAIALSMVVLPAPLAPRMVTISPRATWSATSASAWCLP